jgi:hypothetical protein
MKQCVVQCSYVQELCSIIYSLVTKIQQVVLALEMRARCVAEKGLDECNTDVEAMGMHPAKVRS